MNARRWRAVALLAAGMAIGVLFAGTPVGAHVSTNWLHNWTTHIRPKADPRYLPGGTMPPGKTIRGTYWMADTAAAGFSLATSEISFGYKLFKTAPTGHFVQFGDTPPAECPGDVDNPLAAPGHLCIYEGTTVNVGVRGFNGPAGDGSTFRFGTRLWLRSAAAGDFRSFGTWAATSN